MLYRRFPKIPHKEISILGLGCMRFPVLSDKKTVDKNATKNLIQTAYNEGINYFDTAYTYHNEKSEIILGECLEELNLRDKIFIADKSPIWRIHSKEDWMKILDEQLRRLKTDHIDFYLLHALNKERWNTVETLEGLEFLEKAQKMGKILHLGFSFHDYLEVFKNIVDSYENWDFCQIQLNYIDQHYQAGLEGLAYAYKKGLGVITMESLRGGLLANPPQDIINIFAKAPIPRLPAEWALRWLWNNQEVTCALSGMNDIGQLLVNCATATSGKPNSLPQEQLNTIEKSAQWFAKKIKVPCTACNYCLLCPKNVDIPTIFQEYNNLSLAGKIDTTEKIYSVALHNLNEQKKGTNQCVSCGACLAKCPQKIAIPEKLQEIKKITL